jgi:hypothetical protein
MRIRHWTVAVGVASGIAGIGACTLTTSLEGIVGVRPDAAPDGGVSDAGTDGGFDATTDVGADTGVDAPSGPFCQQAAHDFCADFDKGKLDVGWFMLIEDPGSVGALDYDASVSPPASFSANAHVDGGGSGSGVQLVYLSFTGQPGGVHTTLDLRIDACDPANPTVTLLSLSPNTTVHKLLYEPSTGNGIFRETYLVDGSGVTKDYVVGKLTPLGQWVRVTIDLVYSPVGTNATVIFHPLMPGADSMFQQTIGPIVPLGGFDVDLGVNSPPNACRAHFDNFAADFKP